MRITLINSIAAAGLLALPACIVREDDEPTKQAAPAAAQVVDSGVIATPSYATITEDTAGTGARMARFAAWDTAFKRITSGTTNAKLARFPASIPPEGPSTLHVQILLDRARFSPGILDGMWGDNAANALRWFRFANGIDTATAQAVTDSTAIIDQATYQKLVSAAGSTPVITQYTVTADDVKGPFVDIPDQVYDQAKLDCLCYSSAAEALAEKFHTSKRTLSQLNPRVSIDSIAAGTTIAVPNVAGKTGATPASVAKVIVSRASFWVHGVDSAGKVVWHAPSTLGAGYDPSPTGDYRITGIAQNPTFHYQPSLFAEVPDSRPEANLAAGPNSPVGVVWMSLSKPHYGIHGTSSPETIGYASSHGCVRLTNWDARELSTAVRTGTPVEFQ